MPDSELSTAFEQQVQVVASLESFASNYAKTGKDRWSLGYLEAREKGLNELWASFTDNHRKIVAQADDELQANDPYFVKDWFAKYEALVYDVAGRICQKRRELAPPPPPPPSLQSTSSAINQQQQQAASASSTLVTGQQAPAADPLPLQVAPVHHIKIPRLNVPEFGGEYEDWPSFRDLFVAAVHLNPSVPAVHKLQYLKSLLTGQAATILKHIPTTADSYAVAWRKLEERFNNKRALINTTLQKLFSQRAAEDSAVGLRQLLDSTRESIEALHVQGVDTASWDPILVYMISQLVPASSLDMWEQTVPRNQLPTIEHLLNFLEDRFRALEFTATVSTNSSRSRAKPQSFLTAAAVCGICQGPKHPIRVCPSFVDMSAEQRLNYVSKAKLCKNCFAFSHQTQACKSAGTCNVCGLRHHSMLHLASANRNQSSTLSPASSSFVPASSVPASSSQASAPRPFQQHSTSHVSRPISAASEETVLATAMVIVKAFNGQSHSFRALLDNASQESFISRRVMQFIGVKPQQTSMVISGVGQSQAPKPLGQIAFEFGSHYDSSFSMKVNAIVLPVITHTLPARSVAVDQQLVANLHLADPTYGTPGSIDVLLSANVFASLMLQSVRKFDDVSTVALHTQLGWVLFGEASPEAAQQHRTCFHVSTEDHVSAVLQEFWKVEEVPVPVNRSPDDTRCEEIYEATHTRTPEGRYVVHTPFKVDPPTLGCSRDRAVSRFLQVERKLSLNPQLHKDYAKCINEYLQLGHMRPLSSSEQHQRITLPDDTTTYTSYYLPHHAVIKMESTTTKLRVVFDASSQTQNGISLNEMQLTGPVLQDTLFGLLTRWRMYQVVIKADITKMYRQVLVADKHQPYQRIVWRNRPSDELQDFQLQTVTFGTAAAPYLAIKTLQQLGKDEAARFPLGAIMLQNDFYVDDLLSGADSVAEAIEKQRQAVQMLQSGGFEIRKWSSNRVEVTERLDDEAREICKGEDATLKALGIIWCPNSDMLSIKVCLPDVPVSSKRSLLSEVSKLYDPLGWIAPSIICMKILLQNLWLAGVTWDEPLPSSILAEWFSFKKLLPAIESIPIPRWIGLAPQAVAELHGFCDASEKAYAAAVYVRVQKSSKEWDVFLITAKTKVAPVKQISLPRLELCGAVLLSKLLVLIKATIKVDLIHAWTDSEIVLAWLQGHPNRWATFVANRISDIHQTLDANAWHHVPSKDNPADCASRGIAPDQLICHPIWWQGPAWLSKDESHWPRKHKQEIAPTELEAKCSRQSLVTTVPANDTIDQIIIDCRSLMKVENVIARMLRWHKRPQSMSENITVAEQTHARNIVLRHVQQTHFQDEVQQLSQSLPLRKSSKLLTLNPFLDKEQFMRVGGRLENAELSYDTRHPIIVPRKSRFTELLVREAHKETLHGSVALIQSHLRARYWIIDARNTIRHTIHRCNTCFRHSSQALTQLMGQLPKPRVNVSLPFSHTGVDYAGPITILMRRSPGRPILAKGYICLLVCLATKAIHLELVGDMSAESFLAALSRFIGRRGKPSDIYSDNGTYFVKAATDIEADLQKTLKEHSQTAASSTQTRSIQWHFIPPAAPHFGGLWEAGVKSMKYHLKRMGNEESHHTYEELATMLCQIEGCLNSRPLCPMSSDPNDFEVLTPGHFLIGRPLCSRPQPSTLEVPPSRLRYWQRIYNNTERFWKQWQSEYLTRLQQRPKWATASPNIEEGELVLLKEDNLPPSQWKLARIMEVHRGTDGQVRVVTIKTPTSTLKRPIVKVCQLPSQ